MPRISKGKKRLQKVKKTVRRGKRSRRVRTGGGDSGTCDDMDTRIAKYGILNKDHTKGGPLRAEIVDNFIEEIGINEIKELLTTAILDFASDSQSYSTGASFYCEQTITPIDVLKKKFNELSNISYELSNEITVDKLLKNKILDKLLKT